MDSGVFFLREIIELIKVVCFGVAAIKIRRYWPNKFNVVAVKYHFSGKEVGYADSIYVVIDGQHYHICGMKDPDYTMMLMP